MKLKTQLSLLCLILAEDLTPKGGKVGLTNGFYIAHRSLPPFVD